MKETIGNMQDAELVVYRCIGDTGTPMQGYLEASRQPTPYSLTDWEVAWRCTGGMLLVGGRAVRVGDLLLHTCGGTVACVLVEPAGFRSVRCRTGEVREIIADWEAKTAQQQARQANAHKKNAPVAPSLGRFPG